MSDNNHDAQVGFIGREFLRRYPKGTVGVCPAIAHILPNPLRVIDVEVCGEAGNKYVQVSVEEHLGFPVGEVVNFPGVVVVDDNRHKIHYVGTGSVINIPSGTDYSYQDNS